jgi:hypothetical protein
MSSSTGGSDVGPITATSAGVSCLDQPGAGADLAAAQAGDSALGRPGPLHRCHPGGTIPGEPREITITSADLTGLMDQLDDLMPSGHGTPGWQPT